MNFLTVARPRGSELCMIGAVRKKEKLFMMFTSLILTLLLALPAQAGVFSICASEKPEMMSYAQVWQEVCQLTGKSGVMPRIVLVNPKELSMDDLYQKAMLTRYPGYYSKADHTVYLRFDKKLTASILAHELTHALGLGERWAEWVEWRVSNKGKENIGWWIR